MDHFTNAKTSRSWVLIIDNMSEKQYCVIKMWRTAQITINCDSLTSKTYVYVTFTGTRVPPLQNDANVSCRSVHQLPAHVFNLLYPATTVYSTRITIITNKSYEQLKIE